MLRVVPTRLHGIMDYPMAALTAASPWLFRYARGGPETWIPVALAGTSLVLNAMTDHEAAAARRIPMPTHLKADIANGALLALSPWLFGFSRRVTLPHVLLGAMDVVAASLSKTQPSDRGAMA